MPSDIINLRRVRKQKARADKEREAEANRLRYGRSSAERRLDEARRLQDARRLDGLRIEALPRGPESAD